MKLAELREFNAKVIESRIVENFLFPMWYHYDAALTRDQQSADVVIYYQSKDTHVEIHTVCNGDGTYRVGDICASVCVQSYEYDVEIQVWFHDPCEDQSDRALDYSISITPEQCETRELSEAMQEDPAMCGYTEMSELCSQLESIVTEINDKGNPLQPTLLFSREERESNEQ
jgi:serine/threonine protein phosphatase PrpC